MVVFYGWINSFVSRRQKLFSGRDVSTTMEQVNNQKSLAQLIGEAAACQCKGCDGKGWTLKAGAGISYIQCPKCQGRGKIDTCHAS